LYDAETRDGGAAPARGATLLVREIAYRTPPSMPRDGRGGDSGARSSPWRANACYAKPRGRVAAPA